MTSPSYPQAVPLHTAPVTSKNICLHFKIGTPRGDFKSTKINKKPSTFAKEFANTPGNSESITVTTNDEWKKSVKYLGIILDKRLMWIPQINRIRQKPATASSHQIKTCIRNYKAIVRNQMTYDIPN